MATPERFHPIGMPGQPWGEAERAQWRAAQQRRRSYADDVLDAVEHLRRHWDVVEPGLDDAGNGGAAQLAVDVQQQAVVEDGVRDGADVIGQDEGAPVEQGPGLGGAVEGHAAAGRSAQPHVVVLAGGVAAKRIPTLVAKTVLVSIATGAIVGGWFFVGFPSADFPAADVSLGALLYLAATILAATAAIAVLRARR